MEINMKRSLFRAGVLLLSVLLLLSCLAVTALADSRTEVSEIVATSDLSECAVLYGRMKRQSFEVTEGAPAYFNQSFSSWWYRYNEETEAWDNFNERILPGTYRVEAQVRIDGDYGLTHVLSENLTCTVDGEAWTVSDVSVHSNYSCVFVSSPAFTIEDDPSITPPVDVESVDLSLTGYREGGRFSETTLTPILGSESAVELARDPIFVELTDKNENGVPDFIEAVEPTPADDLIRADGIYLVFIALKAKEGYVLYDLEAKNVRFPAHPTDVPETLFGYNEETDEWNALLFLSSPPPSASFTVSPEDTAGYCIEGEGETVEISWETSHAADSYVIYKWSEADGWSETPYAETTESSYLFEYNGGGTEGRYRVEAKILGETVAVSEEFTVSWRELKAIKPPIRIDVKDAAGSKTPISLVDHYHESEEYFFDTESEGLNVWYDAQTDLPVSSFEDGKRYYYPIVVIAKEGYYFKSAVGIRGMSDIVRAYGIGWDGSENSQYGYFEFETVLFMTYDAEEGILAERDGLLHELVFDGSPLVGTMTPTRLGDSLFIHEALTPCGENCECDILPDMLKSAIGYWIKVGEEEPAAAIEVGGAYTASVFFHVKDGWLGTVTSSPFDFVLSGTGIETLEVLYDPEYKMLGVHLGFICGESGIEPGEHTCIKKRIDRVSPTCSESGLIEHYACACGRTFLDKWGIYAIADITTDGKIDATGHSFGTEWLTDGGLHYNSCACGARGNSAAHADSDSDRKCDVCGTEVTPPHTHVYSEELLSDESEHYKECSCGDKTLVGTHVDNNGNASCDVCGRALPSTDGGKKLDTGAVIAIIAGSVAVVGIGAFALIWFVIKKKSFADLIAVFKK